MKKKPAIQALSFICKSFSSNFNLKDCFTAIIQSIAVKQSFL